MRYSDFDDEDEPVQGAERTGFLSDTNLKVIGGCLAVIGGALSFLGQHPKGYWVFITLAVVVFLWILVPRLVSLGRRITSSRSDRLYVARECPRLKRFYERLMPFVDQNDGRSFRYLLFNSSTSQNSVVSTILG